MGSALFKQQTAQAATKGPEKKETGDGANPSEPRLRARPPDRAGDDAGAASVLGPGTTVVGRINSQGDLQLEGRVEGTISTRGRVLISDRGSVEGDIDAGEIVVSGVVQGKLAAREVVRLRSGCRVTGELRSPAVELEEGGVLDGRVEMSGSGGPGGRAAEGKAGPGGAGTMGKAGPGGPAPEAKGGPDAPAAEGKAGRPAGD